jgi:hypothetical protein
MSRIAKGSLSERAVERCPSEVRGDYWFLPELGDGIASAVPASVSARSEFFPENARFSRKSN